MIIIPRIFRGPETGFQEPLRRRRDQQRELLAHESKDDMRVQLHLALDPPISTFWWYEPCHGSHDDT